MEGHEDSINCMEIDGNILFTGSDDGTIRLWTLGNFEPSGRIGEANKEDEAIYSQNAIMSLKLITESGLLLAISEDKTIKVWYTQKKMMIDSFSKEEVPLCIEYIGEENIMLLGSESGDILTHPIGDYMQMN